ncbi:MAG: glycosyltransferase family 2 protein [Clostridia bacterium]|nr:glycosyltransferase family 2 protein [Clostridia bacterium]
MRTLIVIPAYNEESSILSTVRCVLDHNERTGASYDVLVINDGSTDGTEDILRENGIPHVRLIENLGIGGAVQTGFKYAVTHGYDIAVQFDGDGQHDVEYVKDIVGEIEAGRCNMAIGSRFVKKEKKGFKSSAARRMGIKIISAFIRLLTRKRICDPTSGFRACDRELTALFAENYPTEYPEPVSEVTVLKRKYRISEVPVEMHERKGGRSSIRAWKNVYYMVNVLIAMLVESLKRY